MHIILIYLSLNFLASFSIILLKRYLHPAEISTYLLLASILCHDFFAIVYLNLDLIKASDEYALFLLVALNRAFLFPVIANWFLLAFWKFKGFIKKSILIVIFTGILSFVEYLGDWLGLISHVDEWVIWWTLLEFFIILMIAVFFSRFIRYHLYSEVKL